MGKLTNAAGALDALATWEKNRGVIHSSKGGWIIGRGVLNQGYEMMSDFVGKLSYMQVIFFNAIGRIPSRQLADWSEAVCICLSWPDPRIWCNHIGALGGTARASALPSTMAGVMATESNFYGVKPIVEGADFIVRAKKHYEDNQDIGAMLNDLCIWRGGKPRMMGYARPIAHGDERVPALEAVRQKLQLKKGPHLSLAFAVDQYLQDNFKESININGYVAAFMADNGYSGDDVYHIFVSAVASGVTACFMDTAKKPPNTFLPLKCGDINYLGRNRRQVP